MLKRTGILRRHHGSDTLEEGTFLDLGAMGFDEEESTAGAKAVRMAEVMRAEDVHNLAKLAYQGDLVLIDYTSIANDQNAVRRMSLDLKSVAKDVGGDVAGIAKNLVCLTPGGYRIDRQKIRTAL
ncbi:MAG TPA: cell division protein SepF [Thermoplasmata archaeon]|nr:cell division protein SepF [Thermoplasmata archaeon]